MQSYLISTRESCVCCSKMQSMLQRKPLNCKDCNFHLFQSVIRLVLPTLISHTGYSDWKFSKVNGFRNETVCFWYYVGKAKMRLRGCRFFQFWKFVYNFQLFVYIFFKISTVAQTHFCFSNIGSNMHLFSSTAIHFEQFFNWNALYTVYTNIILGHFVLGYDILGHIVQGISSWGRQ